MNIYHLNSFNMNVPEIIFEYNGLQRLGELIKRLGCKNPLVITDEGVVKAGILDKIETLLENEKIKNGHFDKVEKEPSLNNIESALFEAKKSSHDLLIGLGGGSAIDVTKMVSILLKYGGKAKDYLGIDKIPGKGLPTILVPTTAGTGSEVSKFAIFDDTDAKTKLGAVSSYMIANVALIDPELTISLPKSVTAATGSDAFIHAVEGYLSPNSSLISDMMALEAIGVIHKNLPIAFCDGSNKKARYQMAYGALLGGFCLNLAGGSSSHALAYPIGSHYHVPHGVGCMLTFLEVMEYFSVAAVEKFLKIGKAIGIETEKLSERDTVKETIKEMRKMALDIQITHKLSDINFDKNLIEPFAKSVIQNQQRLLSNGPRKLDLNDIISIYEKSY